MANLFLTGSGVPTNAVGEVTDYYRDIVSNLIYYRAPTTGWEPVPSLIPTPDGVGTHWYFGNGVPNHGLGEADDYYRDDANGIIYRKHITNGWEAKGELDFIGVYGVQWGEGIGAPANTTPLNNLPAGSFYLDVATSDIYYKDNTLTWSNKGQLGGGGNSVSALALGETSATAYRGDRGATAYSHSQATGNPHGTAISDITGLQTAIDSAAENFAAPTINTQTVTAYTVGTVSTDNDGKTYLRMTNASANTVTIPSTQTKPISISQRGAGTTTLVADSGVTLNGTLAFTAQHQTKTVIPLGSGIYDVVG